MFHKTIGIQSIDEKEHQLKYRTAVRAIIIDNEKILVVQSNSGDFKVPGGGIEGKESHNEALIREVAEETGYLSCEVKEKIGEVIERHIDMFDSNVIFQMDSHYYLCEVHGKNGPQQLDDYELEEEYKPKWVSIHEVISNNQLLIDQKRWLHREDFVLEEVRKNFFKKKLKSTDKPLS
jgi:8-oxo-dGTP pyrophosphatase MutT (NUDIX family)